MVVGMDQIIQTSSFYCDRLKDTLDSGESLYQRGKFYNVHLTRNVAEGGRKETIAHEVVFLATV